MLTIPCLNAGVAEIYAGETKKIIPKNCSAVTEIISDEKSRYGIIFGTVTRYATKKEMEAADKKGEVDRLIWSDNGDFISVGNEPYGMKDRSVVLEFLKGGKVEISLFDTSHACGFIRKTVVNESVIKSLDPECKADMASGLTLSRRLTQYLYDFALQQGDFRPVKKKS